MFNFSFNQPKRKILHVDADAFFASVEQVLDPTLKKKPVLVGGPDKKYGIVTVASYEARKYGVHAGMPMYLAIKKCPKAIVVGGHFDMYHCFSQGMYRVFLSYTPDVEMGSIDEAYLDLTGCEKMHGKSSVMIARCISLDIHKKLGISVSCGLSSSKLVSKTASGLNKPHKLTVIPYGKEARFLAPLPLRCLPGFGPKTVEYLERFGFKKVGELSSLSFNEVFEKFGVHGVGLWKLSLGADSSTVMSHRPLPKSISKERTFYQATNCQKLHVSVLRKLMIQVLSKLRAHKMKANVVFIKIRYKNFQSECFRKHLGYPQSLDSQIFPVIKNLFLKNFSQDSPIRLLGIGVTNLTQNYSPTLFAPDHSQENLFLSIDKLKKLYGEHVLSYGVD